MLAGALEELGVHADRVEAGHGAGGQARGAGRNDEVTHLDVRVGLAAGDAHVLVLVVHALQMGGGRQELGEVLVPVLVVGEDGGQRSVAGLLLVAATHVLDQALAGLRGLHPGDAQGL